MSIERVTVVTVPIVLAASASAAAATGSSAPSWTSTLSELAQQSEDIMKLQATVVSIAGTIVAIIGGLLTMRKTRAEIAVLESRAKAAPKDTLPIASLLTDARVGLALIIAIVIATIITMLTRFALNLVVAPFHGILGSWVYDVLQGIIIAALFLPIAGKARKLKKIVTAAP